MVNVPWDSQGSGSPTMQQSTADDPFTALQSNPMGMMLMRQMMPQMFGAEPEKSLWDDAVPCGLTQVGGQTTVGVLSVMVLEPTKEHPLARLRIVTNGPCDGAQKHLERIGKACLEWAKDPELAKALETAKKMESQQMLGGMVIKN